jgi:hypothetical protein
MSHDFRMPDALVSHCVIAGLDTAPQQLSVHGVEVTSFPYPLN